MLAPWAKLQKWWSKTELKQQVEPIPCLEAE